MDETRYWSKSSMALEPLGPYRAYWGTNQRQAGGQAGQFAQVQLNVVQSCFPGKTLKEYRLEQENHKLIPFLEELWGLQVSFCTSVARRVMLREVVADLLPTFAAAIYSKEQQIYWRELRTNYDIVNSFKSGDLATWFRSLPSQLYQYALRLVRDILDVLKQTGIDREEKYLSVAWPTERELLRCFRIPCKRQSAWTRVLADSEDCATFAYISSKCLETKMIKCNRLLRAWNNTTLLLETAVFRHAEGLATDLQNDGVYFFKKLKTFLYVKVQRQNRTDPASLILCPMSMAQHLQRRILMKEKTRIREKQASYDSGETVVVSAVKAMV